MLNQLKKIYRLIKSIIISPIYHQILIPFHYQNWQKYRSHIFLVYSMGKVGSSTIFYTLKKQLPVSELHQVHFLSDYWLKTILPKLNKAYHWNIAFGNNIRQILQKNPNKKRNIITLVREPISREISNIFQNMNAIFEHENISQIDDLYSHLNNYDNYIYTLEWFDTEFKNFTNINIYDYPFDHEKGFIIIKENDYNLLCIKLERINDCFKIALAEFMDLECDRLVTANVTDNKLDYKQLNKRLQKELSIDQHLVNKLYNSKYVQHFYTPKEINVFQQRWTKKD